MAITVYDIIQGPVISEKAYRLKNRNVIMVRVHPQANKVQIAKALEELYNVEVISVRTCRRKGKRRVYKRQETVGKMRKYAYITLQQGYSLNFFEQMNAAQPENQS